MRTSTLEALAGLRVGEIADLLPKLTPEERREIDAILATDTAVWRPLPGPQTEAYHSKADIIGYGGAAGGGKTDLACGLALTCHSTSAIFRRESTQLTAVIDRLTALLGHRKGFNGQDKIWRLGDRQIEFGSAPHAGDERRHQGRPKDLLVLDEATNLLESQARFLMGWVRTTKPGQRCRTLMTFNPPTDAEGRWIIKFFAPWLDDKHPNPARLGELRWFATIGEHDVETDDGAPFVMIDGERVYDFNPRDFEETKIIRPQTRTFIPSKVSDNPFLARTGYVATLQGLPEPLRSQMLEGDFRAGMEDDEWQVIPTAWVDAAMARWEARDAKGPMDSMGVDIAHGGKDKTVISRRHGTWFDTLLDYPGAETSDGSIAGARIIQHRRDRSPIHFDVVGWGAGVNTFLKENEVQCVPVNGANTSKARTKDGAMGFYNMRAELWWRMREALDPLNPDPIALPDDSTLKADLCAPRYNVTTRGYKIEDKEAVKDRIGRSPDKGDAVVLALMATAKRDDDEGAAPVRGSWMG